MNTICVSDSNSIEAIYQSIVDGVKDTIEKIYLCANSRGPMIVWADDYERARYYARFKHDERFYGVALSDDLYQEVCRLAVAVTQRDFREALVMSKSHMDVIRTKLIGKDRLVSIRQHDDLVISFLFTNKDV